MLRPPLLALLSTLALAGSAHAGKKPKEVLIVAPVPVAPPVQAPMTGLFPEVVAGLDPGGLPPGLASLSAQSCNACHYTAHDSWAGSAHGAGGSEAWRVAVAEIGSPACTSCHLPLGIQRPETFAFDAGDTNRVLTAANPAFDATLSLEGVSCAACHVRQGRVISANPVATPPQAHPTMGWSPELRSAEACATCHQLTWPGADAPLYDTYGEWKRSDYAAAGVDCATCHLGSGANPGPVSHALQAELARALTVEIGAPGVRIVRGGEPLAIQVALTNTGAGHSVPSGSPWKALQVELALEGPGPKEALLEVGRTDTLLGRTLSLTAPWAPDSDTRLAVGERREIPWSAALDRDAPSGPWTFVVRVREVIAGQPAPQPILERRLLLVVD